MVEHDDVGVGEHHFGYHATHFFATREYVAGLLDVVAREEHFAEVLSEEEVFGVWRELCEPIGEVEFLVEKLCVVEG